MTSDDLKWPKMTPTLISTMLSFPFLADHVSQYKPWVLIWLLKSRAKWRSDTVQRSTDIRTPCRTKIWLVRVGPDETCPESYFVRRSRPVLWPGTVLPWISSNRFASWYILITDDRVIGLSRSGGPDSRPAKIKKNVKIPLSLYMRKDLFEYFEFSQSFHFCTLSKTQILESPTLRDMGLNFGLSFRKSSGPGIPYQLHLVPLLKPT